MKGLFTYSLTAAWLVSQAFALPVATPVVVEKRSVATLAIPAGTIVGSVVGSIESYGGIPFAEPPTGSLRLKPPVRLNTSLEAFDATGFGPSCPQMYSSTSDSSFLTKVLNDLTNNPLVTAVTDETEDCLTINVQRPAGTLADANLPVLFW
jgi:carboxylesterase type B